MATLQLTPTQALYHRVRSPRELYVGQGTGVGVSRDCRGMLPPVHIRTLETIIMQAPLFFVTTL